MKILPEATTWRRTREYLEIQTRPIRVKRAMLSVGVGYPTRELNVLLSPSESRFLIMVRSESVRDSESVQLEVAHPSRYGSSIRVISNQHPRSSESRFRALLSRAPGVPASQPPLEARFKL